MATTSAPSTTRPGRPNSHRATHRQRSTAPSGFTVTLSAKGVATPFIMAAEIIMFAMFVFAIMAADLAAWVLPLQKRNRVVMTELTLTIIAVSLFASRLLGLPQVIAFDLPVVIVSFTFILPVAAILGALILGHRQVGATMRRH